MPVCKRRWRSSSFSTTKKYVLPSNLTNFLCVLTSILLHWGRDPLTVFILIIFLVGDQPPVPAWCRWVRNIQAPLSPHTPLDLHFLSGQKENKKKQKNQKQQRQPDCSNYYRVNVELTGGWVTKCTRLSAGIQNAAQARRWNGGKQFSRSQYQRFAGKLIMPRKLLGKSEGFDLPW